MEKLTPNSIYILLYLRTSPPEPDNYHWALYHHLDTTQGGVKHHIKNEGSGWIPEHTHTANIMKEVLLVGAFRIAVLPSRPGDSEQGVLASFEECVRAFDGGLNEGVGGVVFTCRVWVLEVLGLLNKGVSFVHGEEDGGGKGILKGGGLAALEREVMDWGNGLAAEADRNVQPRAVGESGLCGLDQGC